MVISGDARKPNTMDDAVSNPESAAPVSAQDVEGQLEGDGAAFHKEQPLYNLAWDELNYTIEQGGGKGRRVIISQASGDVTAGQLCCIMGPSGAGKSSLLNTLSGRVSSSSGSKHSVSGRIMLNGGVIDPVNHRGTFAYVMQEDALVGTATPREALRFSADLRLGPGPTSAEKDRLVSDMIATLGLEKVADSLIGNAMIRGISGGEKKRTAIGVELITQPGLLFLDEPTSGLDSFSAFRVVKVLQGLARTGCSILCTIHQPSSEIFHLFDSAILMESGEIVYNGPVGDVAAIFECPNFNNPADHVMHMLQTNVPKMKDMRDNAPNATVSPGPAVDEDGVVKSENIKGHGGSLSPTRQAAGASTDTMLSLAREANRRTSLQPPPPSGIGARNSDVVPTTASFCTQLACLAVREKRNTVRDKASLIARFFINGFLSAIMACIFSYVGDRSKSGYELTSHFGALTFLAISSHGYQT